MGGTWLCCSPSSPPGWGPADGTALPSARCLQGDRVSIQSRMWGPGSMVSILLPFCDSRVTFVETDTCRRYRRAVGQGSVAH